MSDERHRTDPWGDSDDCSARWYCGYRLLCRAQVAMDEHPEEWQVFIDGVLTGRCTTREGARALAVQQAKDLAWAATVFVPQFPISPPPFWKQ